MLVPSPGEAGHDERDLRQPAQPQVVQVITLAAPGALVVRPSLPEDEHVVAVPERHAVPADVVDLPRHARGLEQIEDDRIIEDPLPPAPLLVNPPEGSPPTYKLVSPTRAS